MPDTVKYKVPLPPCDGARMLESLRIIELKHKIVVAATDNRHCERHRIICIDRELPRQLIVEEDPREYTAEECRVRLDRLVAQGGGTIKKPATAYGVLGFICLVESYHMAIIERRRSVGRLAGHEVFAVEQVSFIQVYSGKMSDEAKKHEAKYIKYLSDSHNTSPCFFSYSYDLTHTLQSNMGGNPVPGAVAQERPGGRFRDMYCWNYQLLHGGGFLRRVACKQWGVAIICGYFEQRTIQLPSSATGSVILTLIARRSRHFAGTRYLKRGLTHEGFVANHVESEHILSEPGLGRNLSDVRHSSYAQVRGSVPLFWSQVSDAMVPKPDVLLSRVDPMYRATQLHLESLVASYGAPLMMLDLLKLHEKKPREMFLGSEFAMAMQCLGVTQVLPSEAGGGDEHGAVGVEGGCGGESGDDLGAYLMQWDFANEKKSDPDGFAAKLQTLSEKLVRRTGFFCSGPAVAVGGGADVLEGVRGWAHAHGREQRGIIRTNCLDCLDRSNAAACVIALVALAFQMSAHGHYARLPRDDGCGKLSLPPARANTQTYTSGRLVEINLAEMYNEMGDTLAQHYAGTNAQKKTVESASAPPRAAAASKLKSIMVSINRYYRNSFTDLDKQRALDLFHGVFVPPAPSCIHAQHLWETDIETLDYQHQRCCARPCHSRLADVQCPSADDALTQAPTAPEYPGGLRGDRDSTERLGWLHGAKNAFLARRPDGGGQVQEDPAYYTTLLRSMSDILQKDSAPLSSAHAVSAAASAAAAAAVAQQRSAGSFPSSSEEGPEARPCASGSGGYRRVVEDLKRAEWREECFCRFHQVHCLTAFDDLLKANTYLSTTKNASVPRPPLPRTPPLPPSSSCVPPLAELAEAPMPTEAQQQRCLGAWPWVYRGDGPRIRTLSVADFDRFELKECSGDMRKELRRLGSALAGGADEGAASGASVDAHSIALAKYFHFETDTSWDATPLRSGGATAGSWAEAGRAEAGRKEKRGEVMTSGYHSSASDKMGRETAGSSEECAVALRTGQRAAPDGMLAGEARCGWALAHGPTRYLKDGDGECRREPVSDQDSLYAFSTTGGPDLDFYRRSLILERLVSDSVATLGGD